MAKRDAALLKKLLRANPGIKVEKLKQDLALLERLRRMGLLKNRGYRLAPPYAGRSVSRQSGLPDSRTLRTRYSL